MPTIFSILIFTTTTWQISVVGQQRAADAQEARVLIGEQVLGARRVEIGLPAETWYQPQWSEVVNGTSSLQNLPTCQLPVIAPVSEGAPEDFLLRWFNKVEISYTADPAVPIRLILPRANGESVTLELTQECFDYLLGEAKAELDAGHLKLEDLCLRCPVLNQLLDLIEERNVPIRRELERRWADIQAVGSGRGRDDFQSAINSDNPDKLARLTKSSYRLVQVQALANKAVSPKLLIQALFNPAEDVTAFWAAAHNPALDPIWLDVWIETWGGYADAAGAPLLKVIIGHPRLSVATLQRIAQAKNPLINYLALDELDRRASAEALKASP